MGKIVLTDAYIVFASNDLSDHIASITLQTSLDIVDTTAMGDTAKRRAAGLADNSLALEIHQDFAAGSVESIVWPTIGTNVAMVVRPTSAVVSTSNPQYAFDALVADWSPLDGAVGALATVKVTWSISGPITKTTS